MTKGTRIYIATIALSAAASGGGLYLHGGDVTTEQVTAVLLLAGLAVVAEMLVLVLPGAKGSIAFIPYLAAVLIAPSGFAVAAIVAVKVATETLLRTRRVFALFNTAEHVLTSAVTIAVYRLCGGESLLEYQAATIAEVTMQAGFPALAAFCSSFLTNGLLVCGLISVRDKKPMAQ